MLKALIENIHSSWQTLFLSESEKPYFKVLDEFLEKEYAHHTVFPPPKFIFSAFRNVSFQGVNVLILGQDPYHGKGEAHGLSFSVQHEVKIPPSLRNIYKELRTDLGIEPPSHGNLEGWTSQGVLLLNAILTVRADSPGSHQNKGWEIFTDTLISMLSENRSNLVFMLWGKYAQNKSALIDSKKHLVLACPHPSPFSAHTGFFGCRHFSKANAYLQNKGVKKVDWQIKEAGLFQN